MKKLLKSIWKQSYGQYNFAELKNGKVYYISTGKRIPEHCITFPKYKRLPDGFYGLSKYICGGAAGCRIGKPAAKCSAKGVVNKRQCGKYSLIKITNFFLSINNLLNIIEDMSK